MVLFTVCGWNVAFYEGVGRGGVCCASDECILTTGLREN